MKALKYQDLLIDFDDTLYDTYGNAVIALQELFQDFSLSHYFTDPQLFYDAYWTANIDLWTRYSKGEIMRDFLIAERFRRPLLTSAAYRAEGHSSDNILHYSLQLSDHFLDLCSSKPGVVAGAHQLMEYLRQRGYRLHMASNGFHEVQYKKLEACGLRRYFDTIILSEDAGANKPSAQFFDYALRQAGASRDTTLMIGDNLQTDILGAKRAGLDTIFLNRFPDHEVSKEATFTVTSLTDIMSIL